MHPVMDAALTLEVASSKYKPVASLRLATAAAPSVLVLPLRSLITSQSPGCSVLRALRSIVLFHRLALADGAGLGTLRYMHILIPGTTTFIISLPPGKIGRKREPIWQSGHSVRRRAISSLSSKKCSRCSGSGSA